MWKKVADSASPATATADSKQSLYASAGAVLTQYELDVKDATLSARSSVVLPTKRSVRVAVTGSRVLYVAWSAGTTDR